MPSNIKQKRSLNLGFRAAIPPLTVNISRKIVRPMLTVRGRIKVKAVQI